MTMREVPGISTVSLIPLTQKATWQIPSRTMPRSNISFVSAETPEYFDALEQVTENAIEHDFYVEQIVAYGFMVMMCAGEPNAGHQSVAVDEKGWALLTEKDDFVEIKFVFVHPEHRRKGWFTVLLQTLRARNKRITVCSRESGMIRALVARGFSLNGRSANGEELFYILEPEVPLVCTR